MKFLSKLIYFKILNWKVKGNISFSTEKIKKCIIIPVPHTSWHDFYIGILLRSVSSVNTRFLGKKELFIFPFSILLKWLNFFPVDRFKKGNKAYLFIKGTTYVLNLKGFSQALKKIK